MFAGVIRENPRESVATSFGYRTSKLTTVPATTFIPGDGHCVTITLAGDGCSGCAAAGSAGTGETPVELSLPVSGATAGGGATLTFPNRNPASCNVLLALPSRSPTKLGITNACGGPAAV